MGEINYSPTIQDIANREIAAHERLKQAYLNIVNRRNWFNDYFVTLTFKPGYKNDEAQRGVDAQQYLRRLDRAFLGSAAKKRGKKLYRYAVFELNKSGDLHIHMLLENPGSESFKASEHEKIIIDTWLRMKCSGRSKLANKVLLVDRTPERVYEYMHKNIRASNSLMVDPKLCYLPTDSSQRESLGNAESQ